VTAGAPFVDELRGELLAAARREARRHRRRPLVAAVAAVATAVVALVLLLAPRPTTAAAEVVVRVHDGIVEVTLVDLEHRPEQIEAAVREAGLDVRVRSVPVGPSSVGRFVGEDSGGTLPGELEPVDDGPAGFRGFVLPVGWSGELHLLVGAPAGEREVWARFSDATAPGEALACRAVVGRRADVVAAELAEAPVAVRYRAGGAEGTQVVPPGQLQSPPWSGWVVAAALGTRRGEVVLHLVPPAEAPAIAPPPAGCGR
jgi:hypothetical protein